MALVVKGPFVTFKDFSLPLCRILTALAIIHNKKTISQPVNLVITSANDGKHKVDSKHYKNQALDLRSKSFKNETDKHEFMTALSNELGNKFTVLYEYPGGENEHFHVQVKKDEVFP